MDFKRCVKNMFALFSCRENLISVKYVMSCAGAGLYTKRKTEFMVCPYHHHVVKP